MSELESLGAGFLAFDADNHYYEALDAFTRHADPKMANRCVQWCEINGRQYHVVGGRVSDRVSSGQVSERYSTSRLKKQKVSTGQTSDVLGKRRRGTYGRGGSAVRKARSTRRSSACMARLSRRLR